jgi:branched-chain amino acid transport system substrate-binding protein
MGRLRIQVAAMLCLLLVATACGGGEQGEQGGGPIIIGAAVARTGIMSQFDEPVVQGLEVAIDEINQEGGVAGRQLELVVSDHRSDLDLVRESALDVIDEGAQIMVTTHDFDFGSPAAAVARENEMLTLGGAGGMSYGRQGLGPFAFNLYPGNVTEGASMAQFAFDQGYERPYLMQDLSILYTQEVCEFFEKHWANIGAGPLAGKSTFQNDDASFASQVSDLQGTDADVIVICSYPPGGAALIRQARAAGIDVPIVASGGGMDGTRWLDAVPGLSDYYDTVMASLFEDDPRPEVNALFTEIEERYGSVPQLAAQALTGYSAAYVVKRAVEEADGSIEGATLAQIIEGFQNEDLLVGPVTYSPDCHIPVGMPMQIRRIQEGEPSWLATVDPESVPESPC